MKLEKAIEILKDYKMESAFEATPDFKDALKLGIEALETIAVVNDNVLPQYQIHLPGETKE